MSSLEVACPGCHDRFHVDVAILKPVPRAHQIFIQCPTCCGTYSVSACALTMDRQRRGPAGLQRIRRIKTKNRSVALDARDAWAGKSTTPVARE
jgi:hypothetical protein